MCAQAGTLSTADTNADTPKVRGAKCIYLSIGSEFSLNRLEGRIRLPKALRILNHSHDSGSTVSCFNAKFDDGHTANKLEYKLGQKTAETGGHTQEADPKTPKWSPKK